MSKKIIIFIYVFLIIFFSISIAPKVFQNDTYFTIAVGENILKNGLNNVDNLTWHDNLEFTNDRYVFDVIITTLYNKLGFFGVYLFVMVMTALIACTLFYIYNKIYINIHLSFVFTLAIIYMGNMFLAARAQIVSIWLFILENYFILKLLNTNKKIYSILLIIIAIALANVHASIFLVYFIFFLPYFVEFVFSKLHIIEDKDSKIYIIKRKNIMILLITFLFSAVAGLCSPLGMAPYTSMLKGVSGISNDIIVELQPLLIINSVPFVLLMSITILILLLSKTKINLASAFMILGLSIMAINSNRALFYFIFIGSIYIVELINDFFKDYGLYKYEIKNIIKSGYFVLIICIISLISLNKIISKMSINYIDTLGYPVDACKFINNNLDKENMRIYNSFNYGSYMEFEGIKTFIDSRSGMFSKEFNNTTVLEDFNKVSSGLVNYEEIFDKYNITHLLITNTDIIKKYIVNDKNWELIYFDDGFSIYKRV